MASIYDNDEFPSRDFFRFRGDMSYDAIGFGFYSRFVKKYI